ncbi:hypothetical protein ACO0LE_09435 [Undibacterium sp. Xuan67W]
MKILYAAATIAMSNMAQLAKSNPRDGKIRTETAIDMAAPKENGTLIQRIKVPAKLTR